MYDIKFGNGCGIKATLLTPSGAVCDLRRARFIGATLVLPSGATMPCVDVSFNEITCAVYVRLLADRELTAKGRYAIVFNVRTSDNTAYSSDTLPFAEVKEDAPANYIDLTIIASVVVPGFPETAPYLRRLANIEFEWNVAADGRGDIIAQPIVKVTT